MRVKIPLFVFLALAWIASASTLPVYGQDTKTVTGVVTSADDQAPLPGTSISIKGTSRGTVSDSDGEYEIQAASDETLVFSFVGFVTREVRVRDRTTIDVALRPDFQELSEVVVTGYGSQIQKDVTGNISRVSAADIEDRSVNSFEEALQGQAAGVFIEQGNGKLGQGIQVQVRGISSLSADTQPLFVVDGIPVTTTNLSTNGAPTNPLSDINPGDIESIEILKDAAASAIYGARGSNGVVLITTKNGREGQTRFRVDYRMSTSSPTNKVDFMNAEQYVAHFLEAGDNVGARETIVQTFDFLAQGTDWRDLQVDEDWQDEAFQDASAIQLDISANGGNESTRFYVSGAYSDQTGIVNTDEFNRISGRLNLDHDVSERFLIGGKINLTRTLNQRVSNDNAFSTPIQLVAQPPISPIFTPQQVEDADEDGYFDSYVPTDELNSNTLYFNNLLYEDNVRYDTKIIRAIGNAFASVDILPELKVRSEFGVDILDQREDQFFSSAVDENTGANDGLGFNSDTRVINYTSNTFATYTNEFADVHDLEVVLGTSLQIADREFSEVEAQRFPTDDFTTIDSGGEITGGGGFQTEYSFLSYFTRANYKFNDKYLLTLSTRIDGSSRFGDDNRYGVFPAVSAGWILSEEEFLQDTPFSFLKLRGSWGVTGNAEIDNFAAPGLFEAVRYSGTAGIRASQVPNPNLKWEQTTQVNLGVEYGFWQNRINGTIDVYQKNTDDLLLNVQLPSNTGFTSQLRNVGQMENRGIEIGLNTNNFVGNDFNWSTSFNISFNRNEVTDLNGQVIQGGSINRAIEGEPVGAFFALDYAGVDPNDGDALYFVNAQDDNGNIINPDATTDNPNEANRVVIGSPLPDFQGGFGNEFFYKGIDLNIFFQFVYGNEIYDGGGRFKSANGNFFDNQTVDQLNAWEEPGDITDVPEARYLGSNGTADSDRYLYDGSYLRLKNVTLGYTIPESLVNAARFQNVRIYATATNLLTFTDYKWWDPEVNADYLTDEDVAGNQIALGNEFYSAPQARTITAGLQFTF